ncbi:hypothetical protein ACFT8W_14635 [Streptomyces hygroscopicus]|uniref:hypothetical protein n=2 Tax=Streptomyces hygroscopicus TaxID=1912 RepID=UPI0036404EFD
MPDVRSERFGALASRLASSTDSPPDHRPHRPRTQRKPFDADRTVREDHSMFRLAFLTPTSAVADARKAAVLSLAPAAVAALTTDPPAAAVPAACLDGARS